MGFLAFFFGMYSGPSGSSGSSALLPSVLFGPTCRDFTPLERLRTAAEGACSRKHWHTAGVCVRSTQCGTTRFTPGMGWAKLICHSSTGWRQLFPLSRVTSKQEVLCSKKNKKYISIYFTGCVNENDKRAFKYSIFRWHVPVEAWEEADIDEFYL